MIFCEFSCFFGGEHKIHRKKKTREHLRSAASVLAAASPCTAFKSNCKSMGTSNDDTAKHLTPILHDNLVGIQAMSPLLGLGSERPGATVEIAAN